MKFAVLGDIHGNKYALNAVLKDIKLRDVDFIVSTGDLVGYLPFHNEVISIIRENNILVVKGNHDEVIGKCVPVSSSELLNLTEEELQSNASRLYINSTITTKNRIFLKNLPDSLNLVYGNFSIKVVHGSPFKINEYLYEDINILEKISSNSPDNIVICGHTHIPYHKKVNDTHFINSGSVGKPKHGNSNSTYAVVSLDDNNVECNIIEVKYDITSLTKDIKMNNMISDSLIIGLQEGI